MVESTAWCTTLRCCTFDASDSALCSGGRPLSSASLQKWKTWRKMGPRYSSGILMAYARFSTCWRALFYWSSQCSTARLPMFLAISKPCAWAMDGLSLGRSWMRIFHQWYRKALSMSGEVNYVPLMRTGHQPMWERVSAAWIHQVSGWQYSAMIFPCMMTLHMRINTSHTVRYWTNNMGTKVGGGVHHMPYSYYFCTRVHLEVGT